MRQVAITSAIAGILVAASPAFADATAELVQRFNRDHRGSIALRVTRGPRDTDVSGALPVEKET